MFSISVKNIGKAYREYTNNWQRLIDWFNPFNKKNYKLKWILRDINFDVFPGESIGIIGVNGAGKSTLLKIITGTTKQTEGSVQTNGRTAAMLELGMGFHPDFTGRQNVYMSGQLLGYTQAEIKAAMPAIEAFAEIGDYIDKPIRIYSSGMQVRLAFSLATAIRPDILIIDEALAVGDTLFQQKCYDKIASMKNEGTTLLFVTHDMGTIYKLCDKAVYIKNGKIDFFGEIRNVVSRYESDLKKIEFPASQTKEKSEEKPSKINTLNFISGGIIKNNKKIDAIEECTDFEIFIQFEDTARKQRDIHVGFQIRDAKGNIYYETNTYCQKYFPKQIEGIYTVKFKLNNNLCEGKYIISFGIAENGKGDSSFEKILMHDVGKQQFLVIRKHNDNIWSGLSNLRVTL